MNIDCKILLRSVSPIHYGRGTEKDADGHIIAKIKTDEIFLEDGSIAEVPIIYGNALRGRLRDESAESFIEVTGIKKEEIPLDYQVLLWQAGLLKDIKVRSSDLTKIAKLFPSLALFGFSFGNNMLSGKIFFSHIYPVTKETELETEDILNVISKKMGFRPTPVDASQLVGKTERTRKSDVVMKGKRKGKDKEVDPGQMIWAHEYIKCGVYFTSDIQITNAEKQEVGCFFDVIERFSRRAVLGGLSSIGYGRVKGNMYVKISNGNTSEYLLTLNNGLEKKLLSGEDILDECIEEYRRHLKRNRNTIRRLFREHKTITEKIGKFLEKIKVN